MAVWRPAVSWAPGSTVDVMWSVDRDRVYEELYGYSGMGCSPVEGEQRVEILDEGLPEPELTLATQIEHELVPSRSLQDFVCCDGAYPRIQSAEEQPGICPRPRLVDDEACAPRYAAGWLVVTLSVDDRGLGDLARDNLAVRSLDPYDASSSTGLSVIVRDTAPFCTTFEILDLARGRVYAFESCHEPDASAEVGPALELDVLPDLADCECPPYTCTITDNTWQEHECEPWDPAVGLAELRRCLADPVEPSPQPEYPADDGDEDRGEASSATGLITCGCSTGDRAGWLSILALVLVRLRRRDGTSPPPPRAEAASRRRAPRQAHRA